MNDEILKITDLSIIYKGRYKDVHAVNNVNLSVRPRETLGIVGETGAGKTTLALGILGLLPERTGRIPNGSIEFNGRDLTKMSEKEMNTIRGRLISMIFQDPMTSLNPVIPVGKQIEESLALHNDEKLSKAEIKKKVDEILSQVGIDPSRRGNYPHEFSGGMKQRIVIAMALTCSPQLLIADEPTTALDVTIQAQVLHLIEDMKQKIDMAVVMITHDLGIIAKTCDNVAVMYAGEIVEYGTFEDFFDCNHHHPYTQGLFDSIPSLTGSEDRLKPIDGLMPNPTELPQGCKFHPRCMRCTERCKTEVPHNYEKDGHMIKCHLFEEGEW